MQNPTAESLLATDRHLRSEADDLLEGRGLHALLQQYAKVHVVGSYALELMVWRDLDLTLEGSHISIEEFFDLGRRIALLLSPWKMHFHDNQDRESGRFPHGLYWGVRLGDVRHGAWKIDLWAFDTQEALQKVQECSALKGRLDGPTRLTILRLKSQLWRDPRYRDEVTSQDIYDAVLDHGIRSLDEFWTYVQHRRSL